VSTNDIWAVVPIKELDGAKQRLDAAPTPAQRRALIAGLGDGLGARGELRALWALPPRLDGWSLFGRRHPGVD